MRHTATAYYRTSDPLVLPFLRTSIADEFYSLFYLGLFCESRGENTKAATYMRQAVKTEYAKNQGRGDYMTSCARIHCKLRGW